MNKCDAFDTLFPNSGTQPDNKRKYFRKIFIKNRDEANQLLEKFQQSKLQSKLLSKENVVAALLLNIEEAKKNGKYSDVNTGYNLISKIYGYMINKPQLQFSISEPIEIQYINPEIKQIDDIGNPNESTNDIAINIIPPEK